MKPIKGSYPEYFDNYIPLVKENSVLEALKNNLSQVHSIFVTISPDIENMAYADGKWTIKQLLCHMTDTERIFSYRALRFARKDPQMNLSFEENDYADNASLQHRHLKDLLAEFEAVRHATIAQFAGYTAEDLARKGMMAIGETTVLALGYTICGHATHHIHVLRERYFKNNSSIKI